MRRRCSVTGALAASLVSAFGAASYAESAAPFDRSGTVAPAVPDQPSATTPVSSVRRQATGRGFIFYPSKPELNGFRFAMGAFYDAVDPQVMYGFNVRVPQITLDARYGLGRGWSLRGHLNSMFVTTELLLGGNYGVLAGDWSFEATASVGIYVGKLGQANFDTVFLSPEYRPEVAVGHDFGSIALSLRASLLLMGPDRVRVGDVWGGFDNANAFAGHSEMLFVENTTRSDSVWYFGVGAMTTRSYYALWLLFPDTPGLFTYARVAAGYEF